jgi:IS30 family transposase
MPENNSYRHLDFEKRSLIEKYLNQGMGLAWISKELGLQLSTLTREVKRNRRDDGYRGKFKKSDHICALRKTCNVHALCKTRCRSRRCSTCEGHLCTTMCPLYAPEVCKRNDHAPYCCNGCPKPNGCALHRFRYDARLAQKAADVRLSSSREGINCTADELASLMALVRPLLAQGLGLDAIWAVHNSEIGISQRTFYRWVDLGLGGSSNMELPKKVSYKPRKVHKERQPRKDYTGRTYADFMALDEEDRLSAVEIDCVEGVKDDKKVIFTLFMRCLRFQFGFLLDHHDAASVVGALDYLEGILEGRFPEVFGILLADRGHEFMDIEGMERSVFDAEKRRCRVFFCDPCRPDQKGGAEKNHVEVRKVIPKGTSLDAFSAFDMAVAFSHINSTPRRSLGGVSPFTLALTVLPQSIFDELGLSPILPDDIVLKPSIIETSKPAN